MKKIAFVNQRYGLEVNGGSEYYTRVMAERLSNIYEVEVLTTKALDYMTWENYYTDDVEVIHDITVRRFSVKHNRNKFMLRLANICRKFKIGSRRRAEFQWIKAQGPYAPGLIRYIEQHEADYDVFIFVTYLYYHTVFGMPKVREKAVMIPTAHDEPFIYFDIYQELFQIPRAFVYLTEEEQNFIFNLFHNEHIPNKVLGIGVEIPQEIDQKRFRLKYKIDGSYLIYVGRVDINKGCLEMFQLFEEYRQYNPGLKLILLGKTYLEVPDSPGIISLGFVSDQDKYDAIAGALALWLPSEYESLSISVLEALAIGKPVIVNGRCEVLKGHCLKSQAGVYYMNGDDFKENMACIYSDAYSAMCEKAKLYIDEYYRWNSIIKQFKEVIDNI